MNLILKAVLLYFVVIFMLSENLTAQNNDNSLKACQDRRLATKNSLDTTNPLYQALARGSEGSSIPYDWMKKMRAMRLKQAVGVIGFNLASQEIKLRLEEISYYRRYYDFSKDSLMNGDSKINIYLENDLKLAFYWEAINVIREFRIKTPSSGKLYLNLLDDECLPTVYSTETVELIQ